MLDERSIQIIKKIIESSYILKDELMSSCGLTKRQLEYSIEKINDWIKENGYVSIRFLNDKVSIKPEAVQKYYDGNKSRFEVPEQLKAEYVVLSLTRSCPRLLSAMPRSNPGMKAIRIAINSLKNVAPAIS